MIKSSGQGKLPVIVCEAHSLPADRNVTLTEVACHAIYGAPLTPGTGTLKKYRDLLSAECRTLWSHSDGPIWLRSNLELIAANKRLKFEPTCPEDIRQHTLAWFDKASRWLKVLRFEPAPIDASKDTREAKSRLASCDGPTAIKMALEAANRLEVDEAAINGRSASFYAVLSSEVVAGRVVFEGIPVAAKDGNFIPRELGSPPHTAIPLGYFNLPLVHDLYDNELEFDCFSSEAEIAQYIYNGAQRQFADSLVRYVDVRVPPEGVKRLLAALSAASKPVAESDPKPRKRAGRVTQYKKDEILVAEMEAGRVCGRYTTRFNAATDLSAKAEGSQISDSKARRLDRKYKQAYPASPWNN